MIASKKKKRSNHNAQNMECTRPDQKSKLWTKQKKHIKE
nr:MAG TPA: hypothetical protein [Microviridae sp.]